MKATRRRARESKQFAASCTPLLAALFATLALVPTARAQDAAVLARGKALFTGGAVPACAICHTLADADAAGTIGPDLDELKPDKDVILKVLQEGMGAMPPFASLSAEDKQTLADYIVSVTRTGG